MKWIILETNVPDELLPIKESEWIQGMNSFKKGYNQTLGGETASLNFINGGQAYNKSIMVKIKCNETRRNI